jgi:hypothetical protein
MKYLLLIIFTLTTLSFTACTGKKEETAAAEQTEWPQMDEFHLIMAESFHPYKDSSNLAPAKAQAAEMAANAARWAEAPLPEKVNNEKVKEYIATLKTETAAFAELVKTGDDAQLGEALTDLHDLFHTIQDAWYGRGDGHKHEHKH